MAYTLRTISPTAPPQRLKNGLLHMQVIFSGAGEDNVTAETDVRTLLEAQHWARAKQDELNGVKAASVDVGLQPGQVLADPPAPTAARDFEQLARKMQRYYALEAKHARTPAGNLKTKMAARMTNLWTSQIETEFAAIQDDGGKVGPLWDLLS